MSKKRPFKATVSIVGDFIDKNISEHIFLHLDLSFGEFKMKNQAEKIAKNATARIDTMCNDETVNLYKPYFLPFYLHFFLW